MIKMLISSGLLLLVAAGAIGISKRTSGDNTFQGTTIVRVLADSGTVATAPGDATTNTIIRPQPVKTVTLKEHDLSGTRQVFINGVIDETNSPAIAAKLLDLGKDDKPITIVINSPGGSVIDGAEIISAMQAAKGPVDTVCVQICASMAAMIHQYGTHRLMLDRSIVMFHPASGGVQGEVDKSFSRLGAIREYIAEMELNVASRSKLSYEQYKSLSGVEWWVSAQNAIKNNVTDNIVYVRGPNGAKLFQSSIEMRGEVNRKLPFTVNGVSNGRFYWISLDAYKLLYGNPTAEVTK